MTREALADRIATYCDALVAFSLVNGLAFLVALGEPDIRCSIAEIARFMIAGNVIFAAAVTLGLVALGRAERRFRFAGDAEDDTEDDTEDNTEQKEDAEIARFLRGIHRVRFALIWLFMAIVLVGILGATEDERCRATASMGRSPASALFAAQLDGDR